MDVNGGISRFDITATDTEIIVMPDKMYTEPDLKMISIKENYVLCLRKENDPEKLLIANYSPTSQRNGIRAYLMPENANEEDIDLDKLDYLSTNNVVYGCNEQIVYLYCTYYYEAGTFRVLPYRTLSDNTLERIPEESPQYLTIEDLKGNAHVRLTQPLMIRCNTADRTQNDISVTLSVKVQGFYEGPIQLYALKEGDTEDKEVLIMERNIDLDINQGLYDEWYGQSDAYSKLDGDVYTFYLKQKMGDRMIRMSPFDYSSYTVTFKKDEAAALQLVAPLTINDGKPVKIGKSFKAKITILSATDFEGPIWGNAKSLEYGAWNNAAFIEEKTVKLKANEPQEIEFDGFCYDATKKGEYPIALYYKSNDETYNVEMGEYASSATIQVVSTAISLAAPIVFNDESPMLIGKSHMLKMTLVSDDDYVGTIKGDSYMEINGASERIALLGDIPIDLTANVPKEVSTSINLYGITEPGIYKLNLYHKQESELEVISLGEYTYSANYEMVNFELKPTSALIINNEEDVVQGTTGSVTLNLKSNVNSHTYYRIKDIPNVINGVITYIGLQANQEHQFKVNYNCDKNAPIGEYEIEIIYLHILTQEEEILDLGEYKASAKFKVVSSTGIRGEESTQIYAVAQSDGFVLKGLLGKEEIEVFDLSGRQIYQLYNTSQEVFIPVAGGASNTYLISIRNKSQKFVLKVILPIN